MGAMRMKSFEGLAARVPAGVGIEVFDDNTVWLFHPGDENAGLPARRIPLRAWVDRQMPGLEEWGRM